MVCWHEIESRRIQHEFGIQIYKGSVLSVYSVSVTMKYTPIKQGHTPVSKSHPRITSDDIYTVGTLIRIQPPTRKYIAYS